MSKSIQWLCMIFMLILPSIVPAQEWVARYNGPGNGWDGGNALVVDSAGNVYVTGSSDGVGSLSDYATIVMFQQQNNELCKQAGLTSKF